VEEFPRVLDHEKERTLIFSGEQLKQIFKRLRDIVSREEHRKNLTHYLLDVAPENYLRAVATNGYLVGVVDFIQDAPEWGVLKDNVMLSKDIESILQKYLADDPEVVKLEISKKQLAFVFHGATFRVMRGFLTYPDYKKIIGEVPEFSIQVKADDLRHAIAKLAAIDVNRGDEIASFTTQNDVLIVEMVSDNNDSSRSEIILSDEPERPMRLYLNYRMLEKALKCCDNFITIRYSAETRNPILITSEDKVRVMTLLMPCIGGEGSDE
jgi:DNA polymerase III sliding clamp (beta) subunit (PCNA family)